MDSSENSNGSITGVGNPKRFRVFVASPGDVPLERKLAREAITHISSERRFRGRIDIEIIAWDQPGVAVAMEAGLTPQEAIAQGLPKPEDCDLAVIVLWSRIGTQLPTGFELKEDGTPYLSGTEWEYLNALNAYRSNGRPAVWVYRRKGAPQFAADDLELAEKLDQWKKLETFFAPFTNPDGSLAGGINHYEAPDDFRQQFEHHLHDRLDKLLKTLPEAEAIEPVNKATTTPIWPGPPYPGLEAFTSEQAPIFFGRGPEIDQLLQQFASPQVQFVAVVGASGSGKSSLVKAGLLPRLRTSIVGNAPWIDLCLKPGERGGNPFMALAFALKSALSIAEQTEQEIARAIQADPRVARNHLATLLTQHKPASELLLLIDQFEELFTQSRANDRQDFLRLLEYIVAQPLLRVIITLRADFYARAIEEPALAGLLRRDRSTFPLDPPGMSALHQMIIRPAEAAGVELEEGLVQRLLDDAGEGPGAMALIAFTLHQLYQEEKASRYLSVKAYEASGGVQGAVQKRAERALQGLPIDLDTVLPKLFANLVGVNEQEVATRRRAPQSLLKGDVITAANALTDARLLVTGEGENNQPMLEVAHETVLNGWQRLDDWIREHAESLRIRQDLERTAAEWNDLGQHKAALRMGIVLQRYDKSAKPISSLATHYLQECSRKSAHYKRAKRSLIALPMIFSVFAGIYFLTLIYSHYTSPYLPTPEMETIPAGEFNMGDLSGDGDSDDRTVLFVKAFEMGKYEVTFDEYDLFAAETGRQKPNDEGWGRGRRPVINVSWEDAVAYTQWLSKGLGSNYRLPSEVEWEYAARAMTKTPRYWTEKTKGEQDAACAYANVFDAKNESMIKDRYYVSGDAFNCEDDFPFTAPVGMFQANNWKLHDMLGNVWEWTQDCYIDNYEGAPLDGSPWETTDNSNCVHRVLRGGSWRNEPLLVSSSYRFKHHPDYRLGGIGFRLARTL